MLDGPLQCRKKLTLRQKLQHDDYKVNRGFASACHRDVVEKDCDNDIQNSQASKVVGMATVLVCLERAVRGGNIICLMNVLLTDRFSG